MTTRTTSPWIFSIRFFSEIVRHRPRRRDALHLERDRVRLEDADPDRQEVRLGLVAQDDDGHVRDRIHDQRLHIHLDRHAYPLSSI